MWNPTKWFMWGCWLHAWFRSLKPGGNWGREDEVVEMRTNWNLWGWAGTHEGRLEPTLGFRCLWDLELWWLGGPLEEAGIVCNSTKYIVGIGVRKAEGGNLTGTRKIWRLRCCPSLTRRAGRQVTDRVHEQQTCLMPWTNFLSWSHFCLSNLIRNDQCDPH